MPAPEPRIVATAGHIDHGKSTLVEALTGTNPDRLPEEQKRGMTIELGFARLDLPDPQAVGGGWHIGIVDVPGHADFVRNMVAGVGSIDAALLTVAADDGWMPQTEEHFQILHHLGVTRGVVALTKSDLAALVEKSAAEEVRTRLAGTPWEGAPVIPVCALDGSGLDALRTALAGVLRAGPPPPDTGKPRLFVDRVFSPRGTGTVVTGTLTGGCLRPGDEVLVQPAGLPGKVRGLQNHGRPIDCARPGMRTAVQLSGVEVAHDGTGTGVWRGHSLEGGGALVPNASKVIHVWLDRSFRAEEPSSGPAVKHGQKVWFHHGSSGSESRLYLAEDRCLPQGASGVAELRFAGAVAVHAGDRFILRDFSRRHTLAGGMVLEPSAKARAWKVPRYLQSMRLRASQPGSAGAWVLDLLERDGFLRPAGLLVRSRFSREEVGAALQILPDPVTRGDWMVAADRWDAVVAVAGEAVSSWHAAHPQESGMPLSSLRPVLQKQLPDSTLVEAVVEDLILAGFLRLQGVIRAPGFKPALPPEVRRACLALRGVLFTDKQNPPKISTFVNTP
ncbi:MAG TPA: selenocysteine-specific translation elongation factor, partial [Verrucomicrobiales bacterium]|nr:selenocysteine-specific translation elongation factor [Verrucomicrobiales bacterium]